MPFSENIIKQIHTFVLMDRLEDRGVYRRIPICIMGAYNKQTDSILLPEQVQNLVAEFTTNHNHQLSEGVN